jgi:sodium/hydrogen antiporter
MTFNLWFTIIGLLLIGMALTGSVLKRLPLTTALLYLAIGIALGPMGWQLIQHDPVQFAPVLERIAEIAVLISLFTAGLKLRAPFQDKRWRLPLRLASVSMIVTILLITLTGFYGLGLSLGAALLLGAILAPTDPVLASDVQVEHTSDRDVLRFGLTGEAGLNDGSAFPFVMLGIGVLGLHELGTYGWRWVLVDVVWRIAGGLIVGWLLGTKVSRFVLYLRREHREAVGLDDFLALGLIALSYGAAMLLHAYGFLAVFAAGLALRGVERQESSEAAYEQIVEAQVGEDEDIATDQNKAPAYMAQAVLVFNEQLERIAELTVVLLLGGILTAQYLAVDALWFIPLLFLVIRPISIAIGLFGAEGGRLQHRLIAWFGIRGVGSIYYLTYAVNHGLAPELAQRLTALTLTVVATSIIAHGISVTPLMNLYQKSARTKLGF